MDPELYRQYDYSVSVISENGPFRASRNDIMFWNQGDTVATIDNVMTLNPPDPAANKEGVAFTWPGYPGEMNVHTYWITFDDTTNSNNKLVVYMKIYQENHVH